MRYLNLSVDDYANMSHENANALRSIGVNCEDYSIKFTRNRNNTHVFKYATESKPIRIGEINELAKRFDCIQIFHTDERILKALDHDNIVVYHTGTRYRQNSDYFNVVFKGIKQLTDQTEFVGLGDMRYIAPHTTITAKPKRTDGKIIVGHYPSNPLVKGTSEIRKMLDPFKNEFEIRINERTVPHQRQLQRMSECHIYIELFAPFQQGKVYGCHGVTAFESAALGCFTVTQNLYPEVYEKEYGVNYFHLANDRNSFLETFEGLIGVDRSILTTPLGFYLNHNIESTGYKILELTK